MAVAYLSKSNCSKYLAFGEVILPIGCIRALCATLAPGERCKVTSSAYRRTLKVKIVTVKQTGK